MIKFDEWYLPDGETHLQDNMTIVNKRVNGRLSYQYKKYEMARPFIKNFKHAVDIGGHVGLWSYFFAHEFTHVSAFEPMDTHRECFEKNLTGFNNVILYENALGGESGFVALESRTQGSSGDTQVSTKEKGTIPIKTLDSFGFKGVDFIKIDCEGYEEYALRGAYDTLKKHKPCVIVEQKRDMSRKYGFEKQSAVKFLQDMGAVLRKEISGDFILSWD